MAWGSGVNISGKVLCLHGASFYRYQTSEFGSGIATCTLLSEHQVKAGGQIPLKSVLLPALGFGVIDRELHHREG